MLCRLIRLARRIDEIVADRLRRIARRIAGLIRRAWRDHLDQVANNAAYAAAAGAVIGGLLGFVPARDVIAAVLAAALGLYVNGARPAGGTVRGVDPWDLY